MVKKYEPKCSFLYKLSKLLDRYGKDATFEYVFERAKGLNKYKCPSCNGRGYIKRKYDVFYPKQRTHEVLFNDVKCDVCDGIGYTKEEIVPNYVQDGWKVK
jgi:hypothetical protein